MEDKLSKYVVLDLEMCRVQKKVEKEGFRYASELIQIGAVEMNERYEITRTFMTFVKPEFGALDSFIRKLTGIKPSDLENAPVAAVALREFYDWLEEDSVFVTWSDSDAIQIESELYFKDIDIPGYYRYIDNYIDCQYLFAQMFDTLRQYNLTEALIIANIEYDLNVHDAFTDAKNTAALFVKLECCEDRASFSPYYMTQEESQSYIYNSFAARCTA